MFDDGVYKTATYLGVEKAENGQNLRYRFIIDGKEAVLPINNGENDYSIQNSLKKNHSYKLEIESNTVVSAEETAENVPAYKPLVSGVAGEKTLLNFLKTAIAPVGTTLYIYGGGWDWQDEKGGVQARTIGVSPDWVRFFYENNENFAYKEKSPETGYYPYNGYNEYYYAGLDCSGYVGWVLYNTFETENMQKSYVTGATGMAKKLAAKGFGEWSQEITETKPGDIISINGHVWISLGTCRDSSTLILHSTPSKSRTNKAGGGVQISAIGRSKACEAYNLADEYMSEYYPEWYRRYPAYLCDPDVYFSFTGENSGKFTWSADVLPDGENVRNMTPKEVLEAIFLKGLQN